MGVDFIVPGSNIRSRVFCSSSLTHIPDFGKYTPNRTEYHRMLCPMDKRVTAWIKRNASLHAPFCSQATSMFNAVGKHNGDTAVLVLAGPSAAGIDERLRPYRDNPKLKVFTLNNTMKAVKDADYYTCFEQMAEREFGWYNEADPSRTTLITTPAAHGDLAEHWGGNNVYYSYMGDLMQPHDERWFELPLLVSALTTAVPALQAIHMMGFSNIFIVGGDYSISDVTAYPDNPALIAEGTFYWDGQKYYLHPKEDTECYYNRNEMAGFRGIAGEMCGSNPMLHMHMSAVKCTMEIIEDDGIDIRNCSGQGILDKNCDKSLEASLDEVLKENDHGFENRPTESTAAEQSALQVSAA